MRERAALAVLAAALGGCVHSGQCKPIGDYRSASLSALECAAGGHDKQAQLELGIRYETGNGVGRDLNRAEHYYSLAAASTRKPRYVYAAPVGGQRFGSIAAVDPAGQSDGLPEAKRRLELLRRRPR